MVTAQGRLYLDGVLNYSFEPGLVLPSRLAIARAST